MAIRVQPGAGAGGPTDPLTQEQNMNAAIQNMTQAGPTPVPSRVTPTPMTQSSVNIPPMGQPIQAGNPYMGGAVPMQQVQQMQQGMPMQGVPYGTAMQGVPQGMPMIGTPQVMPTQQGVPQGVPVQQCMPVQSPTAQPGSNQTSAPVSMKQGASYQQATNPRPAAGARAGVRNNQQAQQAQSQSVDGQSADPNQGGADNQAGKGVALNPKMILIIVGIVIALIVVFMILRGRSSNPDDVVEEELFDEDNMDWITTEEQVEEVFAYTEDEITQLKEAGYTIEEIQEYELTRTEASELIKLADRKKREWLENVIEPSLTTASKEYKELLSETWRGLEYRDDMDEFFMSDLAHETRNNYDYEKIDVYGEQLFIKVYLDDADHSKYFFILVTPQQWLELNDTGNVIVTYQYMCPMIYDSDTGFYEEDESRMFITYAEITEILN